MRSADHERLESLLDREGLPGCKAWMDGFGWCVERDGYEYHSECFDWATAADQLVPVIRERRWSERAPGMPR